MVYNDFVIFGICSHPIYKIGMLNKREKKTKSSPIRLLCKMQVNT